MRTIELLDAVKRHHDISSDYAAAKVLGLTRAQVSKYRLGQGCFGDETAVKAADMLGIDAGYVMACMHAERASNPDVCNRWHGVAERLRAAGLAAVMAFLAVVGVGVAPAPADAHPLSVGGRLYLMSNWLLQTFTALCRRANRPTARVLMCRQIALREYTC